MRLASGIIFALCLAFPVAALTQKDSAPGDAVAQAPSQGSNPSPAETPAKKDAPVNPQTPGTEKDASGTPQPDAKSEPKAEPPSAPQAEPKTQPNAEPEPEPKTEPTIELKTEPAGEPKQEEKTEPKGKAEVVGTAANAKHGVGKRTSGETGQAPSLRAPEGTPRKTVVRQGGVDEPKAQIVTGMTPDEANRQRQRAEQLLTSTVENLERIDPQALGAQQQETVSQIHNYMAGARAALKEGDISRAHTLAMKASLLAEDLARH